MQDHLYRFQVVRQIAPNVAQALDEGDGSQVFLLDATPAQGLGNGAETALQNIADAHECETFSSTRRFYIVARSETQCSQIIQSLRSSGMAPCEETLPSDPPSALASQGATALPQPRTDAHATPRAPAFPLPLWAIVAAAISVALVIVLPASLYLLHTFFPSSQPGIEQEWHSSETAPALNLPGALRVDYRDRGDEIELRIEADGTPSLYLDTNQTFTPGAGDLRYSVLPGQAAGLQSLAQPPDSWTQQQTLARVTVAHAHNTTVTTWRLPKRELHPLNGHADIMIEIRQEPSGKKVYYPRAALLRRLYRLDIDTDGNSGRPPASVPIQNPPLIENRHDGVAVPVGSAPNVLLFSGAVSSSGAGASLLLKWQVNAADEVEIQPGIGRVEAAGQRVVAATASQHYQLVARNRYGTVSRDYLMNLPPQPPPQIAAFTASSSSVAPQSTVVLHWDVEGPVTDVRIDPGASGLSARGSREFVVDRTTDFMLVVRGPGGSASSRIMVQTVQPLPPVIAFDAYPAGIEAGQPVTLRWSVNNADHVSIEPGIGAVSPGGSRSLHPYENTRYTLTASGRGGTASHDAFVNVTRPAGAMRGQIVWTGEVHGSQLISIDRDRADSGQLQGALPGAPCILQMVTTKNISIASTPGPRNNYERMVLRVQGNGQVRVIIDWVLQ